jgi:hypothetical protein
MSTDAILGEIKGVFEESETITVRAGEGYY